MVKSSICNSSFQATKNAFQAIGNTPSNICYYAGSLKDGALYTLAGTKSFAISVFNFAFYVELDQATTKSQPKKSNGNSKEQIIDISQPKTGLGHSIAQATNHQITQYKNPLVEYRKDNLKTEDLSLLEKASKLTKGVLKPEDIEKTLFTGGHLYLKDVFLPIITAGRTDFFGTMLLVPTLKNHAFDVNSDKLNQGYLKDCGFKEGSYNNVDAALYTVGSYATFEASILLTNGYINQITTLPMFPYQYQTLATIILNLPLVKNKVMGSKEFRAIAEWVQSFGLIETTKETLAKNIEKILETASPLLISTVDKNITKIAEKSDNSMQSYIINAADHLLNMSGIVKDFAEHGKEFVAKHAADKIVSGALHFTQKSIQTAILYKAVSGACEISPFWTITFGGFFAGGPNQTLEELSLRVLSVSLLLFTSSTGFVTAVVTIPAVLAVNYVVTRRNEYAELKKQQLYKEIEGLEKEIVQLAGKDTIQMLEKKKEQLEKLKKCIEPDTAIKTISNFAFSTFSSVKGYFSPQTTNVAPVKTSIEGLLDADIDTTDLELETLKSFKKQQQEAKAKEKLEKKEEKPSVTFIEKDELRQRKFSEKTTIQVESDSETESDAETKVTTKVTKTTTKKKSEGCGIQ